MANASVRRIELRRREGGDMAEPTRFSAVAIATALVLGACGGGGGESSSESKTEQPAEQPETPAADIVITGTISNEFVPSQAEAKAGTISVAFTSEGGPHTFTVELDEGNETVVQLFSAGTGTGEIELEPGTYRFICVIPGHLDAGMEGTLTVT
jgi:plastocyanin